MNYNMPDRDKRKKTDRGFVLYDEFKDRYNADVWVQESSIAFEPCVWVFVRTSPDKEAEGIHLTPEMAERLITSLQQFVDDSNLEVIEHDGEELLHDTERS